jgi:crotonobetainyl-CoA:carnitine CoA-transferase CaiB-like acyl-CoA transferase
VVAVSVKKFWQGLCRALDLPHLVDDVRFCSNDDRREHKAELIPMLSARFLERTTDEWMVRLERERVPSGPINTLDRVFCDPQVTARQMKIAVEHPSIGQLPMLGNPVKVQGAGEEYAPPPLLGEHTDRVLSDLLGYSDEKIAKLRNAQVI